MKSILCVLLLVAVVHCIIQGRSSRFRCDYTYIKEIDGYLKFHEIPATWEDARLRCSLEGAKLASPLNSVLKSSMKNITEQNCPQCAIFTGIHATFSKGDFYSIEGIPLSKILHAWAEHEPDACENGESCIILLPDGKLADVSCSETYPYLCYKKADNNMVVNVCGTIDNEYTLDKRTGSCYKFHRVPRTWSRAYMACSAEGGYLAILNNEAEAQVIREIFAKHPGAVMLGNFWKDVAFVGFHDWNEHGEWRTINGDTLQEAGYDKFNVGQPDNSTAGEYCGAVFRNALFDDLWCENHYAFICEKNPGSLLCDFDEHYGQQSTL